MPSPSSLQNISPSSPSLFGKEDSEYLGALAAVDLPVPQATTVTEQALSSSELFGPEDPTFLDALSKTTFPDGIERMPHPIGHSSDQRFPENQSLKRRHSDSLEQESNPDNSDSEGPPHPTPKVEVTDTDSNIYGASKFNGYGEYMYRKRAKLNIQNNDMEKTLGGRKSALFKGLAVYINGKTNPSVQQLRQLIIQHGGVFHPYLDRKKMVTHIIASNLTPAKVVEFKHMKVVTPAWLLDSIEAGIVLPWKDYMIGADHRPDESQGSVNLTLKNNQSVAMPVSTGTPFATSTTPLHKEEPISSNNKMSSPPVGSRDLPLHSTDPSTAEQASRIPGYASSDSNPHAKRRMEDPEWRAANTAVAPGFIEGYYKNSRLHHLSTWKMELQDLVAKAAERLQNGDGTTMIGYVSEESKIQFHKPPFPKVTSDEGPYSRIIMHCDFDSFFVSAGLVDRPHLKGKPVVVCHSQGSQGGAISTSEIASSSYEARKFGIKNGMSLGQARKLCPSIHTIPYEFERYKRLSLQFYTILMSYADNLQAVSVDEALADVTSTVESARQTVSIHHPTHDFAKDLAETIRTRVNHATGCEVSIGISHNVMLARIATRRAKPAGSFHIHPGDVTDILSPLDINDLWGFGRSTRSRVQAKFGVTKLGELVRCQKGVLCDALGKKTGETLWKAIRGIDDTKIESDHVRKSVSSEINYGIRFNDNEDAEIFVRKMAIEVSKRLTSIGMRGRSLTLKIMTRDPKAPVEAPKFLGHGLCETTNKSTALEEPGGRSTCDENIIGDCAWRLLKGMYLDPKELRGIGIHVQKLERSSHYQGIQVSGGQSVLPFTKKDTPIDEAKSSPGKKASEYPVVKIDPPSQIVINPDPSLVHDAQYLMPDIPETELPSVSQVDRSFLAALPADIRDEIEREYTRQGYGQPIAGPSRYKTPEAHQLEDHKSPLEHKNSSTMTSPNLARITRQLAPKSRPSISPSKGVHPLFTKRTSPATVKVSAAELKLLDIDPDVWAGLPVELQREQLAAFRAANVGTGLAIRASMSTQAKQERILRRWRRARQRSPSVGIRGKRPAIRAKTLELPKLKQRGKSKSEGPRMSDADDIQDAIGKWVLGFEDDGPRRGDVGYFGKFLERCCETDLGAEMAVDALKWWRVLLRQRWASLEKLNQEADIEPDSDVQKVGRDWWRAFCEVKARMDNIIRERFGGGLSLK